MLETNFFGPLALMQAVMPLLNGGMLVNISSAAAKYAPHQQGIYAASKAALERITEAAGMEQGARMRTLLWCPTGRRRGLWTMSWTAGRTQSLA